VLLLLLLLRGCWGAGAARARGLPILAWWLGSCLGKGLAVWLRGRQAGQGGEGAA